MNIFCLSFRYHDFNLQENENLCLLSRNQLFFYKKWYELILTWTKTEIHNKISTIIKISTRKFLSWKTIRETIFWKWYHFLNRAMEYNFVQMLPNKIIDLFRFHRPLYWIKRNNYCASHLRIPWPSFLIKYEWKFVHTLQCVVFVWWMPLSTKILRQIVMGSLSDFSMKRANPVINYFILSDLNHVQTALQRGQMQCASITESF